MSDHRERRLGSTPKLGLPGAGVIRAALATVLSVIVIASVWEYYAEEVSGFYKLGLDHEIEEIITAAATAVLALIFPTYRLYHLNVKRRQAMLDQTQASSALEYSEIKYRNLVDGLIEGVLIHKDWSIVFANASMATMCGFETPEEFCALGNVEKIIAPHDLQRLQGIRATRMRGDEFPARYRADLVNATGAIIHVELLNRVIEWEGRPAVQTTVVDISEQQENEERLRRFVTEAPIPIMVHAQGGEVMMISKMWTELSGYTVDDIPTIEAWVEKGHESNKEERLQFICGLFESLTPVESQVWITTKTGEKRRWGFRTAPLGNLPDGRKFVISMAVDVTEQEQAREQLETALRELEDQKTVLDEHAIVAVTDRAGVITYVNDKFCETSKYSRDELIGETHSIINSGLHSKAFFAELWQTVAAGNVWHGEVRNRAKDGSYYWVSSTIAPLKDGEGRTTSYIAVRTDISERKRVEDEMVKAIEHAEYANRSKSEFLAHMSHELRTPLNAIIGFSDVLSAETFGEIGNPRYLEYAGDINGAGLYLLNLINDILDVSKIEAGELTADNVETDIGEIITSCLRITEDRSMSKGVTMRSRIVDGLPMVHADPRHVKQILLNLITNAIKFTNEGGEVEVSAAGLRGGGAEVVVTDNGIGIDADDIELVMEPFGQARVSPLVSHQGTGLGLSLSKKLAEVNNGTLVLESEVGKGTTVRVTFAPPPVGHKPAALGDLMNSL